MILLETSFQCIVIQVKDPVNDIDGYYLRDCLSEILDVEKHLHYVNEDQIIIKVPYYVFLTSRNNYEQLIFPVVNLLCKVSTA